MSDIEFNKRIYASLHENVRHRMLILKSLVSCLADDKLNMSLIKDNLGWLIENTQENLDILDEFNKGK